jgi:Spx/MgsR family transcriptional regulator
MKSLDSNNRKFKLYGIKNCDTVRKAQKYLLQHSVVVEFHDFRVDGLSDSTLAVWLSQCGSELLINTRSTTWRQLSAEEQAAAQTADKVADLLLRYPTLIKRPVLCAANGALILGFSPEKYDNFVAENG